MDSESPKKGRILVVEDEEESLHLLTTILQSQGFETITARDGQETLDRVTVEHPDLILLDVLLPVVNGFDVCSRLKNSEKTRLIPIVMITALSESEDRIRGIESGADDFVTKPFNKYELFTRINSLIRVKLLNEQLDNAETVIFSLARVIEAKDAYTEGHTENVSRLGNLLGQTLNLDPERSEALRKGGILHDIGKVAVPDSILNKPAPLTPNEFAIMQLHPLKGEEICRQLNSVRSALPVIRSHHERLDGSGYPDGLSGEEIPLTAQIMAIVDIFDALTSDRPYRKGLSQEQALTIMETEVKRGWWNPEIFQLLTSLVQKPVAAREPQEVFS